MLTFAGGRRPRAAALCDSLTPPGQIFAMIGPAIRRRLWAGFGRSSMSLIDPNPHYLLGHGRVLSIVSTGMLLLVLTMTVVGWSLTY